MEVLSLLDDEANYWEDVSDHLDRRHRVSARLAMPSQVGGPHGEHR